MKAIILGSSAGGGVPQWNCRCPICELARAGDPRVPHRTQSSIAVTEDGENWLLVNASPDLRQQLSETPELHPSRGARHSPISAVLLTNGDVDHVAGLLTLRERQPFDLYATDGVSAAVEANRIFSVCAPDVVSRRNVKLGDVFEPVPGLETELFSVPGKVALWLEDETMVIGEASENTVGLEVRADGRRLVYIPGCAEVSDDVRARVEGADVVLFDGTLWTDSEMIDLSLGTKTGRRMGHQPLSGADGTIKSLEPVSVGRRIFVHINNTNPILVAGSRERVEAEASGWEVGHDGMRITL